MLDCSRMTHRVHTILSILAEDHAPAALRHSILFAIDWPTVAAEAPATGDDATAATLAALRIRGATTSDHQALASLAARLATVAASLTTTGDKAMTAHTAALWGAAAALVGLDAPVHVVAEVPLAIPLRDILGLKPFINGGADIKDTVRDLKATHDKAIADIHALRDILKVPADGNIVDHASAFAERHMRRVDEATAEAHRVNEDNARLRVQVDRMIAAMREDAPAPAKAIPQPGDVVPWAEVEDGALYHRGTGGYPFRMVVGGRALMMYGPDDRDIEHLLNGRHPGVTPSEIEEHPATLIARNLGSDPKAWRRAMREWTANGNKSHATGRRSCPHRQDGDASACDHCCMFG